MNEKSDSGFRSDPAILLQAPVTPKGVKRHRGEGGFRFQDHISIQSKKTTASKQTTKKKKKRENTREKGAGNEFETSFFWHFPQ